MDQSFISVGPWQSEEYRTHQPQPNKPNIHRVKKIRSCNTKQVAPKPSLKKAVSQSIMKREKKVGLHLVERSAIKENSDKSFNQERFGFKKLSQAKIEEKPQQKGKLKIMRSNAQKYFGKKQVERIKIHQHSIPLITRIKKNSTIQKPPAGLTKIQNSLHKLQLMIPTYEKNKPLKSISKKACASNHIIDYLFDKY